MAINPITLARPRAEEAPLQGELNQALVRELLIRAKSAFVAVLMAVGFMWSIIAPSADGLVVALFVTVVALAVIRVVGAIWLQRQPRERFHTMRAFVWFATMSTMVGLTLGAIVLTSYQGLSPMAVAMCSVAMIAINTGGLVSLAGSPLVWLLYVCSNMVAALHFAFAHPLVGHEHTFQVLQVFYCASVIMLLRTVHGSLRSSVVMRLQLAASLEQLRDTQAKLVEASRQAGRIDATTQVLHGVGNVLNSVNVSAALVTEITAKSKTNNLPKVVAMVMEHRDDLARFLRDDPRGKKLPDYLVQLAEAVERDNGAVRGELRSLTTNIDHISAILRSLQVEVAPSNVVETFDVHRLVDDALRVHAASYDQQAIEVVKRFDELPPARLDRYKALQILIVLLANARDAVGRRAPGERRVTIHARRGGGGELEIAVDDNGCGIEPRDLDRIFGLGFTTKPDGRGLGLHYSACAARELRGNLTAHSAGAGHGASFLLALPFAPS